MRTPGRRGRDPSPLVVGASVAQRAPQTLHGVGPTSVSPALIRVLSNALLVPLEGGSPGALPGTKLLIASLSESHAAPSTCRPPRARRTVRSAPSRVRTRRSLGLLLAPLLLVSALAPGAARAVDIEERRLGVSLASEGRCAPALEVLARVQTNPPTDPVVARLDGVCALRLQDHRRAVASLETARAIDPRAKDVDLLLAMAYYHAGRVDDASEAIARARAVDPERAEVLLYSGLVAYAQDDYAGAAMRLDAASQLSEAPVEPMASYFLGRAQVGADDEDEARRAFERVVRDHPGTPWADEAARALAELDGESDVDWWASVEVGLEVDDNALLRGRNVGLPAEISGQSDVRGFWFVDAGASLFEVGGFRTGGVLRYAGSEHDELERFDAHVPGATLWADRALGFGDASLRLQYDFDAAFIDFNEGNRDPFVLSHLVAASLYKPWTGGHYTVLETAFGVDDYGYERFEVPDDTNPATPVCEPGGVTFCGPLLNERNATDRDGLGLGASVLHHLPVPLAVPGLDAPWLEGAYRYQRYWSEGSEYDHHRHQIELGIGVGLPLEVFLRVRGRYAYSDYDNRSVFPDPSDVAATPVGERYFLDNDDREEHETGVRVSLERAFFERFVLTARYSRTRNRSNVDVFRYTRDLFGLSLRVGLGG